MTQSQSAEQLAIEVRELSFTYTQGAESTRLTAEQTLEDIDLLLARGSRCLLIGANGCKYPEYTASHFIPTDIEYRLSAWRSWEIYLVADFGG